MSVLSTHSAKQTNALGQALAQQLEPGDVLLFIGGLGAGKSELARGIARGLGIQGHVTSPSFTILQVYEDGRLPLYHFDWYRINSADELYELALDEYLYAGGVSVIEWPDQAEEALPETYLRIHISITGETNRQLSLTPRGRISFPGRACIGGGKVTILAVDTSGPVCGVAVTQGGAVVYEALAVNKHTHSASLMPMVQEALLRSGLQVSDVDLFAAVTGPGSFTGVRIGVSTVKGLAHGAGKLCAGVNALQALAAGIAQTGVLLCPIQDARAGQVYGAAFQSGMPPVRMVPDMAAKLDLYLDTVLKTAQENQPMLFLGDGVAPCRDRIVERLGERAAFAPPHMALLRPSSAALLAAFESPMDYLALQPYYLRAPQAERARKAKL